MSVILLIEDNDEDYVAFTRAVTDSKIPGAVYRCQNGDQALAYLERCAQSALHNPAALPAIILLDLNMPGSDGRDVLRHLKQDQRFRAIPVVVVTTSSNPRDVYTCYDQGANSYMVKSIDFVRFQRDVNSMIAYWFDTALLPATVDARNEP